MSPTPIIDCDSHLSEPLDLWETHLEARWRDRAHAALRVVNLPGGGACAVLQGRVIGEGRFQGAGGYRAGLPTEALEGTVKGAHWGPAQMNPGGFDPHARVRQMDDMGISRAVAFPSWCMLLNAVRDPELCAAMCRAYNRYAADFCSAYPDRLYAAAAIPMGVAAFAVDELRHAARLGLRAAHVRPNYIRGRALHDPYYYPVWEVAQDLGLPVCLHPAGTPDLPGSYQITTPEVETDHSFAAIVSLPMDNQLTLAQLIFYRVLERFPRLKVACLESNGSWITMLLERLEKRRKLWRGLIELPGESAWEIFRRQGFIAFESDEVALPRLADVLQDNAVWGSDYPHADADHPADARANLAAVDPAIARKILHGNALRLFGLEA
jgi:predicted TIM-barrel fold metal-dependent hydrolase